ncbi:MAG: endonuclease-3 [Planctomycetota bacterium]|jgi:endonuclease-3
MKRADKALRIQRMLDERYPTQPIPLDHSDPFTLLIAVLLSAQTTDLRVNIVTPALFAEGPTPAKMWALGSDRILVHIRSLGLAPTKARNVAKLAETLVEKHESQVPESFEELEALPGVGHKTASVVMSQAFGHPAFAVDTHIHRLAARWGLSNGTTVERTERDLKALFEEQTWNALHLQIIYFGRESCPAIGHDLSTCPICSWAATKKRIADEAKGHRGQRPASRKRAPSKKRAAKKRAVKRSSDKKSISKRS